MKKNQKLAELLMGRAREAGLTDVDVKASDGWETTIQFEQDKLKVVTAAESMVASVRVISGGKLGVAATNKTESGEVTKVIDEAVEVAEFGPRAVFHLPDKAVIDRKPLTNDPKIGELKEIELVDSGRAVIEQVKTALPEMMVNYVGFEYSSGGSFFMNTRGVEVGETSTGCSFGIEISQIHDGDFFQVWRGESSVRPDIDFKKITDEVIDLAKRGKKIVQVKPGRARVVFSPEVVKSLIDYLVTATNGKLVNEGTSKLTGMLGKKVFDTRLTLGEDPLLDWGIGSTAVDDEGVLTTRKSLIEGGEVRNFYYDLTQGVKAGLRSTGNGFRGTYSQADPGLTNVILGGGEKTVNKELAGETEILEVRQVLGAGQNNPYNGDFQFGVNLGYVWRDGEVAGRVKNVAVAGNIFELLGSGLGWLSKDRVWVDAYQLPYMCLDGVTITSGSNTS